MISDGTCSRIETPTWILFDRQALLISSLLGCSDLRLLQVLTYLRASSTRASLSFPHSTCAGRVCLAEYWIRRNSSLHLGTQHMMRKGRYKCCYQQSTSRHHSFSNSAKSLAYFTAIDGCWLAPRSLPNLLTPLLPTNEPRIVSGFTLSIDHHAISLSF